MNKVFSVYIVTLRKNGKSYIGWTDNFLKRQKIHLKKSRAGSKCYFHQALAKYGYEAFDWEIIQHFASNEEAKQAEIFWISTLNTNHCRAGYGFNMTDGGDGAVGHRHSKEHRQLLSTNSVARRPEVRAKMSATRRLMKADHPSKRLNFRVRMTGANNPSAKLTNEQTELIKCSTQTCTELSKEFGISRSRVSEIRKGTRRHV